ncbi:phosphotransferase [Streptomyces shenzhenensis]|uniref:phosphotransferase n=1 Tax=Streptomyces shenzhenensis TaxID=943815 RepID=UPI003D9365E1
MPRSCVPPPVPHAPPLGALLRGRHFLKHHFGGGHAYALRPWIDGRHRHGGRLTRCRCGRLGALLGAVHACLERVMPPKAGTRPATSPHPVESADPADTCALIDGLLAHVRHHRPSDALDELAGHCLLERRALLEQHAGRRPPPGGSVGRVHGDFHPFDMLHKGDAPAAIVGPKVRAYACAYRRAAGATPAQLAAAVRRVWWERLDERGNTRADPRFPATSALAVCDAFMA